MPDGEALGPHGGKGTALQLPEFLREPFSAAMSQSMLLPAFIALFGVAAALFMIGFTGSAPADDQRSRTGAGDAASRRHGWVRGADSANSGAAQRFTSHFDDRFPDGHDDGFRDGFDDDDDYVEYTLSPARTASPERPRRPAGPGACR